MTIITPSDFNVIDFGDFINPQFASQPLKKVLENTNHAWRYYQPATASVCFSAGRGITNATSTFVIPIHPSADDLQYTFRHTFVADTSDTLTRTVSYSNSNSISGWTALYTTSSTTNAGVVNVVDDGPHVIPWTAVAIKVEYSHNSVAWSPHHILVFPSPNTTPTGTQSSGFSCFDDGMLSSAGSPITTEHINRAKSNTLALLSDRKAMAFSYCDDYDFRHMATGELTSGYTTMPHRPLPPCRVYVPGRGPTVNINVRVLGTVASGTNTNLIRVQQFSPPVGSASQAPLLMDADGQIKTGLLECTVINPGLEGYVDVEVALKKGSDDTYLHSAVGWI